MNKKERNMNVYYERKQMPGLLLIFITEHIEEYGYAPTRRDMAKAMGGKSTSVIAGHLRYLARTGAIVCDAKRPRGVVIPNQKAIYFTREEWHLIHAAWGADHKDEILKAAGQTRFVVTTPS